MMKKYITLFSLILMVSATALGQVNKRQKLAQTGMKFLSVNVDARLAAMAGAGTALEYQSVSMTSNTAGMGFMENTAHMNFGHVQWIADIQYSALNAAIRPFNGRFGTFGVQMVAVNYGDFNGTIRDPGESGYIDTGVYSPSAYSVGIGYANNLSSQFSVGGNVKIAHQDLGTSIVGLGDDDYVKKSYAESVLAFDFGVLYRTGIESLKFGMTIRNFSDEVTYEDEGFQLPLVFKIGLSANVFDFFKSINPETHALLMSVDATHPRDFPEQLNVGVEYTFMNMISLRAGYSTPNDDNNFSAGVGFSQSFSNYTMTVDYAYAPYDIFEDVHRFSFRFGF